MTYSASKMILSYEDSYRLFSILPRDIHRIIAAAPARVYHAPFGAPEHEWTYSGLKGVVVFGCDNRAPARSERNPSSINDWFQLVDLRKGKVVWKHQVLELIEYEAEKPFFHVFGGKSRKFGFRFDEDDDAVVFLQEVTKRVVDIPVQKPASKKTKASPKNQRAPISASIISSPVPDSFVHVAHMGTDEKGYVNSSWNVSPEWTKLLQKLEGYGVDAEMVEENLEFVKGFLAGAEAVRGSGVSSSASSDTSEDAWEHVTEKPVPQQPQPQQRSAVPRKPVPTRFYSY